MAAYLRSPYNQIIHTHLCAYSSKPKKDRTVNHHYLWDFTLDLFVVAVLHAYIPVSTETDPESLEPPFATGKEVARREKKVNTLYIYIYIGVSTRWWPLVRHVALETSLTIYLCNMIDTDRYSRWTKDSIPAACNTHYVEPPRPQISMFQRAR